MATWEDITLARKGEASPLKSALNWGIAALCAPACSGTCYRPRPSLNGANGEQVLFRIAQSPEDADTNYKMFASVDFGSFLWLNVHFAVGIDECSWPDFEAQLTPRQTGYIIRHLPTELRAIVLERIRSWYESVFKKELAEGLARIDRQFATGSLLVEGTHDNFVFDIHDEKVQYGHNKLPYTELVIVGRQLAQHPELFGFDADFIRADHLLKDQIL